jgi:hypothetical protein
MRRWWYALFRSDAGVGLFPDIFPLRLAEIRRTSGDGLCVDDGVIDKLLQTNDPSERELLTALSIWVNVEATGVAC